MTKSYLRKYEHLSDMWLSTLEIGAGLLHFVTEVGPESPFIEALPAMVFVSVQKLFSIVKKVVIDAIVTSNLDYCNSLLYSIPKYQQDRLQRILNAAVCIVCLVPKFNDITSVLCDLHWLPVPNRIQYKILLLVHRVRFRVAIVYLIFKDRVVYNLRSNTSFRSYSAFSNNC